MVTNSVIKKINSIRDKTSTYNCERSDHPVSHQHFAFGSFPFEYDMTFGRLRITVTGNDELHRYLRSYNNGEKTKEAVFSAKTGKILIHPVEPNHRPSPITDFLEIKFKPVVIEPDSSCVFFLTFPIEIAVFLESESGKRELLDVVTSARPKFSMYGTSARGVLTRYHESQLNFTIPPVKNYKYGVLRLTINNTTSEWATVGRIILYLKGLELYFDETTSGACAEMKITSKDVATTTFTSGILCNGMQPAVSLFTERKTDSFANTPPTLLNDTTYTMDLGLI